MLSGVAAGLCIWEVITAKISSEKVEARFAKIGGMIFFTEVCFEK